MSVILSFTSIARSVESKGAAQTIRDIEIEALETAWFDSYDSEAYDSDGYLTIDAMTAVRGAK